MTEQSSAMNLPYLLLSAITIVYVIECSVFIKRWIYCNFFCDFLHFKVCGRIFAKITYLKIKFHEKTPHFSCNCDNTV